MTKLEEKREIRNYILNSKESFKLSKLYIDLEKNGISKDKSLVLDIMSQLYEDGLINRMHISDGTCMYKSKRSEQQMENSAGFLDVNNEELTKSAKIESADKKDEDNVAENDLLNIEESKKIEIKFAKVVESSDAKIPEKRDEDAGYDIYPCFDEPFIRIPRHKTVLIPTGIASALPENYYFQIEERGSTGSKGLKKSAGVIDSGYRGEWFIAIANTNHCDAYVAKEEYVVALKDAAQILSHDIIIYPYEKGIAQAVLLEVPKTKVEEITYDELKEIKSLRGEGALGSSNK